MEWSPQQEQALRLASSWRKRSDRPYFTLAGYAGTGKTTLARHLAADAGGKVFRALGRAMRWGKIADFEVLEGGDASYTWGFRFTADTTGMKAAGVHVPGGVICTWWK
jgi:nicotinamide riboside kinase